MVITPNTNVRLLKVPLEISGENQLTFSNSTVQYNYFNSLPKIELDNYTYQRKDGTIRVGAGFDDLYQYNYVMYQNESYSNKWFYAYISGMEYINDNVTALKIKTDTWQTYQFDLNFKPVFVEREHTNNDAIGANTIEEGMQLGEYVINSSQTLRPDRTTQTATGETINWITPIFFQVTEMLSQFSVVDLHYYEAQYNSIFSGLYYFACCSLKDARSIIQMYASAGKSDAIVAIFLGPKEFLNGSYWFTSGNTSIYVPADTTGTSRLLESARGTITRPSTINGYTPKNNKLFTYPYSYVYVTNNVGVDATFNYEDFINATPKFYMAGALGQGCTIKLCPVGYKTGVNAETFEYGVAGAKYPICAWASDYYTNWVTQNAVNNVNPIVKAGMGAVSGAMLGGGIGAAVGGGISLISSVMDVVGRHYEASVIPDQAKGNTSSSDILLAWRRYYTVDCMSIRAEIARSIDEYFSQFGYKTNRVKIPNITGRQNWNYVKTIGCYIEANIPQDDLDEIKNQFDSGITFWHNPATFADYSQSNNII